MLKRTCKERMKRPLAFGCFHCAPVGLRLGGLFSACGLDNSKVLSHFHEFCTSQSDDCCSLLRSHAMALFASMPQLHLALRSQLSCALALSTFLSSLVW